MRLSPPAAGGAAGAAHRRRFASSSSTTTAAAAGDAAAAGREHRQQQPPPPLPPRLPRRWRDGNAASPLLRVETHVLRSRLLPGPRRVDVLLPPSYSSGCAGGAGGAGGSRPPSSSSASTSSSYPLLIVHDGQNVVDPATSFSGVDWGLDEAMLALTATAAADDDADGDEDGDDGDGDGDGDDDGNSEAVGGGGGGRIREFIAALVWNDGAARGREFFPQAPLRWLSGREGCFYERVEPRFFNPTSDAYVDFLADELLPFLRQAYYSSSGGDDEDNGAAALNPPGDGDGDVALMGSSMGGLISLYALQRRPEVFSAAACLSTSWPYVDGVCVGWLGSGEPGAMPDPARHRLYFDHGTRGLDAAYGPYQRQADALLAAAGFSEAHGNFMSRVFEGAEHSERAWRARVDAPLEFLFGGVRRRGVRRRRQRQGTAVSE